MDKSRLPDQQVERDLVYGPPGAAHQRHKLDLFRPAGSGWPLLVFVHGGSWNAGDKRPCRSVLSIPTRTSAAFSRPAASAWR